MATSSSTNPSRRGSNREKTGVADGKAGSSLSLLSSTSVSAKPLPQVRLDEDFADPKDEPGILTRSATKLRSQKQAVPALPKLRSGGEDVKPPEEELTSLRAMITTLEDDLQKERQENSKYQKELEELKINELQAIPKRIRVISTLLMSVAKAERKEARMKVQNDSMRLGTLVSSCRAGSVISESWEDGQAIKDVDAHLGRLSELRVALERQWNSIKKQLQDKGDGRGAQSEKDIIIFEETYKSRLASIKREEEEYLRERDKYRIEKGLLMSEMKRIRDEDGSRFNKYEILNQRYVLLNLLGKGGFSEVYKAFDLVEYRYVACKFHSLNGQWNETKKQNYLRHANRECDIQKTLAHRNIVRLRDNFQKDQDTFCTILEFCSGKDLNAVLKATPVLPEEEAKIIIFQIFQGLVYLNQRNPRIIHYDLKPGNVLFDTFGIAKVSDFGLSKIVEDAGSQGIELTSQGTGTYWYLPPECFQPRKTRISSKVYVWSAGIILYQMLFGRRPFGHDKTPEQLLLEGTIVNAQKVDIPSTPSVSNEAKEFIRRCLTYNQADRPDVLTIAKDQYLIYSKK